MAGITSLPRSSRDSNKGGDTSVPVTAALRAVGMGLLDAHVRHCVTESIEAGDGEQKVEELMSAVARFSNR